MDTLIQPAMLLNIADAVVLKLSYQPSRLNSSTKSTVTPLNSSPVIEN